MKNKLITGLALLTMIMLITGMAFVKAPNDISMADTTSAAVKLVNVNGVGEITVTPDGSEPLHNSMVNGNPLLPARTNGKTFTLNLASAKVLMDEVKELIDLFGEAIANDIAIKELESQKNEIHEYNSAGINLVKFAIEGMMETINDAKLAIESRMKVLSAFNVDLDSLDQYLS